MLYCSSRNLAKKTMRSYEQTLKLLGVYLEKQFQITDVQLGYIARDMFALLPIEYIYIHATDIMVNSANGHNEEYTVLSVKIDKQKLNRLSFDNIDCSDSMSNFEHNMKFQKTAGFKPVIKLQIS